MSVLSLPTSDMAGGDLMGMSVLSVGDDVRTSLRVDGRRQRMVLDRFEDHPTKTCQPVIIDLGKLSVRGHVTPEFS
jgi:hypothetical protein